MNTKIMHRGFGVLSFVIALVTYLLTVQPTIPFWDCGEFTAAAVWQQVPHPPGAPLFLMVAKIFHLIPIGDPGWRVNLVSVVASATTIGLLYLIIVQCINHFRNTSIQNFGDALAVYGSAFIGALAYTFSDTFWFNAVESEVYAASTLFVALIVWLMMRWSEEADNPGNERYLLIIAYLIGLSTGVHLFSILTMFSIALIVYFRRYEFKLSTFILTGVISVVAFGIIYPGIVKVLPSMLGGNLLRTEAREFVISDNFLVTLIALGLIGLTGFGSWYGVKKNKPVVNLVCSAFLLILLGYSTYAQIMLRSNARPPMNENTPDTFARLTSYLSREQYGDAPSWPRRYQTGGKYEEKHKRYGVWSAPPSKEVSRKDGARFYLPDYDKMKKNFSGEMSFLFDYQINHMYLRYFFWNFVGRVGDAQDAPASLAGTKNSAAYKAYNYGSGYGDLFPINFYAIPLIMGLIGLFFHFRKDKTIAFTYLALFLMSGVLAAIAQNQQNPQPRERDYFYVGSFFVWCMWIGMGVYSIIEAARKNESKPALTGGIIALAALVIPVNMAAGGWKMHSRAGNYIPFDFSYNVLQSLEKDAIVFTYGDNDTFPLWYMQDVAGVRRDVRIVNTSLGQTGWYINELKNLSPWGAKKIPLSFTDESLLAEEDDQKAIAPSYNAAIPVTIPVRKEILARFSNDPNVINRGEMSYVFNGSGSPIQREGSDPYYFIGVNHQLIKDIIEVTRFERPVYFTPGTNEFCGLDKYLRWEGLALRVCPVPQNQDGFEAFNEEIMDKCLFDVDNTDNYSTTPNYAFKFRNLNNPDVYYDENARRFPDSYRLAYLQYAMNLVNNGKKNEKVVRILNALDKHISPTQFPMGYALEFQQAEIYRRAGEMKMAKKYAELTAKSCEYLIANRSLWDIERYTRQVTPHELAAKSYLIMRQYDKAKLMMTKMSEEMGGQNDPRLRYEIDNIDVAKLEDAGDIKGAFDLAQEFTGKYMKDPSLSGAQVNWMIRLEELRKKMGASAPPVAMDSSLMPK